MFIKVRKNLWFARSFIFVLISCYIDAYVSYIYSSMSCGEKIVKQSKQAHIFSLYRKFLLLILFLSATIRSSTSSSSTNCNLLRFSHNRTYKRLIIIVVIIYYKFCAVIYIPNIFRLTAFIWSTPDNT